jgi:hypothetical protein
VSGQIYAPDALLPGKEPPVSIGWVGLRTGLDDVERRKILPLPGLELRPLCRPALSQWLYRLRYPGLNSYTHMCLYGSLQDLAYPGQGQDHTWLTRRAKPFMSFSFSLFYLHKIVRGIKNSRTLAYLDKRRADEKGLDQHQIIPAASGWGI